MLWWVVHAGRRLGLASIAAFAATAPITALHFGAVQPAGILANLVVVPLAEAVVLPLSVAGVLVTVVWAPAGMLLLSVAELAAGLLVELVSFIGSMALVFEVPPPRPLELVGLGLGLAALLSRRRFVVMGGLAIAAGAVVSCALPRGSSGTVVTFLDVGQGDAAVIQTGDETWLLDAGGRSFGAAEPDGSTDDRLRATQMDPGEHAVWPFLRAKRVRRLDVVVLSHAHPDHFSGLRALASHVVIGEVWVGPDEVHEPTWTALLEHLRAHGTRVVAASTGTSRSTGKANLSVLAPAKGDTDRSLNDGSLVVRLEVSGRRVLFPGDVEAMGEAALTAAVPDLSADVLKAPHHGSRTSSTPTLMAATQPDLVVVSCGAGNRFRFPAADVVERWESMGARVLRTDLHGAVTVGIEPDGRMEVQVFRAAAPASND